MLFRKAFRSYFRRHLFRLFGAPFLSDVRRAYDRLPRQLSGGSPPGSDAFRMACRISFSAAWDKAYPPAFKGALYEVLFQQPSPPSERPVFRRHFRASFRARLQAPFRDEMLLVISRAYRELPSSGLNAAFRNRFVAAFHRSFGNAFDNAFGYAYP
jgi:hypothetical protein